MINIKTLDAKWLDPDCHDGCKSLKFKSQLATLTAEMDMFKAFHKNLCEASGLFHDEKDWRRDLASLTEHVRTLTAENQRLRELAEGLLDDCKAGSLDHNINKLEDARATLARLKKGEKP